MGQLAYIRAGIASALNIRVYPWWPSRGIVTPAVLVMPASGSFNESTEPGRSVYEIELTILTGIMPRTEDAERGLDALIGPPSEPGSVAGMIAADPTLGGTVQYATLDGWRDNGSHEINETKYIGVVALLVVTA